MSDHENKNTSADTNNVGNADPASGTQTVAPNGVDAAHAGAAPNAKTEDPSADFVEPDLAQKLTEAQAKAAEYYDAFLRAKADQENIRRRAAEDVAKAHKFAVESFAESMVPVADSLEAALANQSTDLTTVRGGVELTLKQLQAAFEKAKLIPIEPVGEKFDPNKHQAISTVAAPEGIAPNHVVSVLQKGYLIADRVLRPALVVVAQS
jgi:molecular chaperone GrpE